MGHRARLGQRRAVGLVVEKVAFAHGRDPGEQHFHERLACRVVDILFAEARQHPVVQLPPIAQGLAVGGGFQIEAPAENPVPPVRVRVDEPRERRLTGQASRHLEVGRLAREPRDASRGIGEEREAALEFVAGVNAIGEPTELARGDRNLRRGNRDRGDRTARVRRPVAVTAGLAVTAGTLVRTRAGPTRGTGRRTGSGVGTGSAAGSRRAGGTGCGRAATVAGVRRILQGT